MEDLVSRVLEGLEFCLGVVYTGDLDVVGVDLDRVWPLKPDVCDEDGEEDGREGILVGGRGRFVSGDQGPRPVSVL